jgi:EAL and modified HD-GYP domain-containing signal transduction protein
MQISASEPRNRYAFAYQPVLDERQASVAVELRYRLPPDTAQADPMQVANVIIGAFIHSGLDDLLRHRRAHVLANAALLASSLPTLLPADHIVFELDADVAEDAGALAACRALKQRGFSFAWRACDFDADVPAEWLALMDIVKFNVRHLGQPGFAARLSRLRQGPVRLQACHVERREDFDLARHQGFTLFQGYYFAHPTEIAGTRSDPDMLAVLDLLDKLAADADDPVIEAIFKDSPRLTLHLLRLVNSSAFAAHPPIRSLKHAFAILGRQQLERWLHVLLFALDGSDGAASPLMELALRRARFMEYILRYRTHATGSLLQDESYLTGILSLADALMNWPLAKVVERLHVADEVKAALLERAGPLGKLLRLAESLEAADFETIEAVAAELQLTPEAVMQSQNVAMVWAHGIVEPGAEDGTEDGAPAA